MLQIVEAETEEQVDQVRELMRAFIAWHMVRHKEDIELVNAYFDGGAFEEELASLPGKYSPPKGRLLLALLDGEPAGCVALRQIDASTCEMKRMFVYPELHGHGIGRALAEEIVHQAKLAGYRRMVLDTGPRQVEAHGLYHGLGFRETGPYYSMSDEMARWLLFMERDL